MNSALRRLTHLAGGSTYRSPPFPRASSIARLIRCKSDSCMSPARQITKSPDGLKRRRVGVGCSSPIKRQKFASMSPLLVQEIKDEVAPPAKLELTPVESTLRDLLLDVAKYIDSAPGSSTTETHVELPEDLAKQPIVLRFTGGWVRDKLLGVPSHDIDVGINKTTGYQFGLRMKEYLEIPGNLEKYGLASLAANDRQSHKAGASDKSKVFGGLHKIEANPEKSKHLETTTMRILGLDIDLVNLRKETYSDDSRNPQMEFGTPEEDALRRDATVNAMFYNINTQQIEDFTGLGHEDMAKKIIRTPLEPYQTFKDDPLRVLRLIRFASRLGYTIDGATLQAMGNDDIKYELRRKISRERVGTEVEKALQGPDPHEAMRLIFSLNLYDTIWSDPALRSEDHYMPDVEGWETILDTLKAMINGSGTIQENLLRNKDEQFLAWQLAAVIPYRDAPQPEPTEFSKKNPPPFAVQVVREGIKAPNKISDVISAAIRNQSEIADLVDRVHGRRRRPDKKFEGKDPAGRDVLGMAIRKWGATWRSQALFSLMIEIVNDLNQIEFIERKYSVFIEHLCSLGIMDAFTLKPLLDGKALAEAIGISPGPWMRDALDVVMAWQLRNPDSSDSEQAIEEVKSHQTNGELTSDLILHFLKLTIRPLFIKATPKSVTEHGRKIATEQLPEKLTMRSMDDELVKPWKSSSNAYSLDILRWAVDSLDEKTVAEAWPLIIPPVLSLVDDWETKYKQVGIELVNALLQATPTSLLERTGLGEVFEMALMPCLTYLPTITPEEDTLPLLSSAYPSLLSLARVRFPTQAEPNQKVSSSDLQRRRLKFLDIIIRKGVLYGYSHCNNYPKIVSVLHDHLAIYLDELGIDSVKHIKYILPMLTETLAHPLGTSSIPTLRGAVGASQALIRNCWPRMVDYRGEVLKGLTLCWLRLDGMEGQDGVQDLCSKLEETVKLLRVAVRGECDFEADCAVLVAAELRLRPLFNS